FGLAACLMAACGPTPTATTTDTTPPTATATAPVSPAPMALTVFKVDSNGLLRPAVTHVPRTSAVAGAALGALDIGAGVSIANGTATVALDRATQARQAEIVYTLTQFATIERVDVAGRTGLTRDDFASY